LLAIGGASAVVVVASRDDKPTRVASPLDKLPKEVAPIKLAGGVANGSTWTFWVRVSQSETQGMSQIQAMIDGMRLPLLFPGGLCTVLTYGSSSGGGGRYDPATPADITFGLGGYVPNAMLTGIVPAAATTVRATFGGVAQPVVISTIANTQLPGFSFFASEVPSVDLVSLVALNANGKTVAQVDSKNPRLPANRPKPIIVQ
jgi:hypothetical protein